MQELTSTFNSALTAASQEGQHNKPPSPTIPPRPLQAPLHTSTSSPGTAPVPSASLVAHGAVSAANSPVVAANSPASVAAPHAPSMQPQNSNPPFRPGPSLLGPLSSAQPAGQARAALPGAPLTAGVSALSGAWHAAGAPSVVAGAQKTVEELQQLIEADPEAIIDLIHAAEAIDSGSADAGMVLLQHH